MAIAAAHIAHGSSVTHKVQPSSRGVPSRVGRVPDRDHLGMRGRVERAAHRIAALRRRSLRPA